MTTPLAPVWDESRFAPCPDCSGTIVIGEFDPITVKLQDADGFPVLDNTGRVMVTTLKLPRHRAATRWAEMPFDPTGLAPSPCAHGLQEHPNGVTHPWAVSWIRAKYMDWVKSGWFCPVCRGEPAPEDMTTPRALA